MNKSKFLELVKHPDLIEEKDLARLQELTSDHPYSQVVHILNAKGHRLFNNPDFEKTLNLAATYSYDRSVLRSIVEGSGPNHQQSISASHSQAALEPEVAAPEAPFIDETPDFNWIHEKDEEPSVSDSSVDDASVAAESEAIGESEGPIDAEPQDLKKLDAPAQDQQLEDNASAGDSNSKDTDSEEQQSATTDKTDKPPKTDTKADKKKLVDTVNKEDPAQNESDLSQGQEPTEGNGKSSKDTSGSEDQLNIEIEASGIHAELLSNLDQLQQTRQQFEELPDDMESENPDDKNEQTEIIDTFIKNSPVLSKPNLSAESEGTSQKDLSKNSAKLSEELASENLAKIYLKQGKRKDAEKIYRKLITKFPQKKGYFANQIEKLKKK